jgi:hypothetical protein
MSSLSRARGLWNAVYAYAPWVEALPITTQKLEEQYSVENIYILFTNTDI